MEKKENSPTNAAEVINKIESGKIKVAQQQKAAKAQKQEQKEQKAGRQRKAPSDEEFLQALIQIWNETHKAVYSREISDKLGIKDADFGRQATRSAMQRLAKQGKVKIVTQSGSKIKFLYTPIKTP